MEDVNSCTVTDCNIYFNGTVECIQPCTFSMYCDIADNTNWPFDYASCIFQYMSRTKSTKKLNIIGHSLVVDIDSIVNNRLWELTSYSGTTYNVTNSLITSPNDPNAFYSCVMLRFIINRHSKELVFQVIIPAVLIIFMNIFTLILDADSHDRWILYTISMFSHFTYHEQLSYMFVINTDSIPNVYSYYCSSYYITLFLMLESLLMKIFIESQNVSQRTITIIDKATKSYAGQFIMKAEATDDKSDVRKNFSRFIDRLLIILLIVFYGYTFITLMPKRGSDATPYGVLFNS